jgi:hypothetical protein
MMIELLCRYNKPLDDTLSKQIENLLSTERIIQGDNFDEEFERKRILKELKQTDSGYEYGEFVFNLKDVTAFNRIDKQHVAVRFFNNSVCIFKMEYQDFKEMYQFEMGVMIKEIEIKELRSETKIELSNE